MFRSVFVPIIVIVCVQMVCLFVIAVYGGIKKSLENSAINMLDDNTLIVRSEIEARLSTQWTNFPVTKKNVKEQYDVLVHKYGEKPLCRSEEIRDEYISSIYETMELTLSRTGVDGAFIILNDSPEHPDSAVIDKKTCLYLKRSETADKAYLLLCSPARYADSSPQMCDENWSSYFRFENKLDSELYYKPVRAAFAGKNTSSDALAYLSGLHKLPGSDDEVLTYSIPITDENGYPFAVVGVDLKKQTMTELLHIPEDNEECVLLAFKTGDNNYQTITVNGSLFENVKSENGRFETIPCSHGHTRTAFELVGKDGSDMTGVIQKIKLYSYSEPSDANELWVISIAQNDDLYAYARKIQMTLLAVTLVALVLSAICILVISRNFSRPITELAASVKEMEPTDKIKLERVGITEIDELVDNIETLSRDATKNMAKTEFFSRMSHDMRTPMNAIISFSSPTLVENASVQQKDAYLAQINSAGQYLLGIINELLDMNKLENGSMKIVLSPVRADTMFDATVDMIRQLAKGVKVNFSFNAEIPEELFISTDKQHLNQIIMNLLANAVKFTQPKGSVCFNAQIRPTGDGKVHGSFSVKDTGVGISKDFIDKMYEPFVQGGTDKPGTGLGLSIAKGIVDSMGGQIRCTSLEGVGTTFDLDFDFYAAERPESDTAADKNEKTFEILKGRRILLCEDHPINAQIAKALLEKQGMTVDTAENGRIGVDMFRQSKPGEFDAILMDIRMPVLNGLDAAREIRALGRPDAKTIPIIAMTANAFAEDIQQALDAGMDKHTAKPVNPKQLYDLLAELITAHQDNDGQQ